MTNKDKLAKLEASLSNPNIAEAQKPAIKAAIEKLKELISKEEKPEKQEKPKPMPNLKKYLSLVKKEESLKKQLKTVSSGSKFNLGKKSELEMAINTIARQQYFYYSKFSDAEQQEYEKLFGVVYEAPDEENETTFEVEIGSIINPDLPKNEPGQIVIAPSKVKVKTLDKAKEIVEKFIFSNDLGGGNFVYGDVFENGKKIGHISYNGQFHKLATKTEAPPKKHTLTDVKLKISEIRSNLRTKSGKGNDNIDFIVETLDFDLVTLPFLMQNKVYGSIILASYAELEKIETTSIDLSDESFKNFLEEYYPDKKDGFATKDSQNMLQLFVGKSQYGATAKNKELIPTMIKLFNQILLTPIVYGSNKDSKFMLHYFNSGPDVYIKELDYGTGLQDYGFVILNGDLEMAELGYVSIQDLIKQGFELDYYYTPQTLAEIKKETKEEEKTPTTEEVTRFYFQDHVFIDEDNKETDISATKEAAMLLDRIKKVSGKNVNLGVNFLTFDMPIKGSKEFAKIGFLDNGGEFKIDVTLPGKDENRSAIVIYFDDYDENTEKSTPRKVQEIIDEAFDDIEEFIEENYNAAKLSVKEKEQDILKKTAQNIIDRDKNEKKFTSIGTEKQIRHTEKGNLDWIDFLTTKKEITSNEFFDNVDMSESFSRQTDYEDFVYEMTKYGSKTKFYKGKLNGKDVIVLENPKEYTEFFSTKDLTPTSDITFYETTPMHALEYGLKSEKPYYLQSINIDSKKGKEHLKRIIDLIKEKDGDLIFGIVKEIPKEYKEILEKEGFTFKSDILFNVLKPAADFKTPKEVVEIIEDTKLSDAKLDKIVNYYIAQVLNEFGVAETEISDIEEQIDGEYLKIEIKVYKNNNVESIFISHSLQEAYKNTFSDSYYTSKPQSGSKFVWKISASEVESFLKKHLDELDSRSRNEIYPFAEFLKEHAETLVGEKVASKTINKIAPEKKEKLKVAYKKHVSEGKRSSKPADKNTTKKGLKLTKRLKMQGVTQEMIDKVNETGEGVLVKAVKRNATGSAHDKAIKGALRPGKRLSADGNIYYEYRKNMSDVTKKGL